MLTKKKNAIWGRYPCCDLVNNAIADILNGKPDSAVNQLMNAIAKAGGYVYEEIEEQANEAQARYWAERKRNS